MTRSCHGHERGYLPGVTRRAIRIAACSIVVVATALGVAPVPTAGASAPTAVRDAAPFTVRGSVEQVAVTGAREGVSAQLVDASGAVVARANVDSQGAVLFRGVSPGRGYVVRVGGDRGRPVTVTDPDTPPDTNRYGSQRLDSGFNYIRTRDGTLLSANVVLPGPPEDGPYPTVVEYSGYDPSNPDATAPASTVAQVLGYATVGVNLRGTGCSGGAFDYFETLQSLDGYDVIETVAAQPWVANGKVGMVGVSYPGLTQLFVAATRPPHLAAITPLSVTDDTYQTLYPGGILNDGFAVGWADARQDDARPEAAGWVRSRIDDGDDTCRRNQALRLQARDVHRQIDRLGAGRSPYADSLAPATFVDEITVPVFLAGAWQDEETGGHFPTMLDDFAPGVVVKATLMNGMHADSLGPDVVTRWAEFLDFYVARRVPSIDPTTRAIASLALSGAFGGGIDLPGDRFDRSLGYDAALAQYEAEPRVRVLFEEGAGGPEGAPVAGFEASFGEWPPSSAQPRAWYFQPGGGLDAAPSAGGTTDRFVYDPSALPRTLGVRSSRGLLGDAPQYDWKPLPEGKAVAYVSDPLDTDTLVLGAGSVDLWLRSSARDVDLEVTVSEVRPDGKETYVQSGWLRASRRALDSQASTELAPVPTYRAADARPLPAGEWSEVRVPLFPFGHLFRAGSSIRVAVQPPGGNRPAWAFDAINAGSGATNELSISAGQPSRVVLPVVAEPQIPETPLPECGSLRGQPCREYVPAANASKGTR
jgi:predicted acyl esterase